VVLTMPPRGSVREARDFQVRVGNCDFSVRGVLFCQQNGLNKTCAQVALRSLLARRAPEEDLSYGQINAWAKWQAYERKRVLLEIECWIAIARRLK
jgi:hypothetical protein